MAIDQLPTVDAKEFTSTDALAQEVIKGLQIAGACIISRLFSEETISKIDEEVEPYMTGDNNLTYFQENVKTAPGLVSKSETYAVDVIGNPLWVAVRDHFLTYETGHHWLGDREMIHRTSAQLGSAAALELRPGAQAQVFHRDDMVSHGHNTEAQEYTLGRDVSLTLFAASSKTHRANGATRIIPGSHLWDYSRKPPPVDDGSIVEAEINRGDGLIILGSVLHGGGANTTESEHRRVYTCGTSCSYLRQPENQYLANDVGKILRLPVAIQRFIGYSPYPPGAGLVNWADPMLVINPSYEPEPVKSQ